MSDGVNNLNNPYIYPNSSLNGLNSNNNAVINKLINQSNQPDSAQISHVSDRRIQNLEEKLQEIKNAQGFIGSFWNSVKNKTKLGIGSNKCEQVIDDYKNNKITFEEAENIISKFGAKQANHVNLTANMATGILAVGAVAISAVATGGLSLAAVALGAGVGALTKTGLKFADRATNKVKGDAVDAKQLGKDAASGALGGAVSVATMGIGTTTVAGATITEQSLKETIKQGFIAGAKAGAISGAATGAGEYSIEAAFEEDVDFDIDEMAKSAAINAAGGAFTGGIMGGIGAGVRYKHIQKLSKQADTLHKTYIEHIDEAKQQINDEFGKMESKSDITGRAKDSKTVLDKLVSKSDRRELTSTKFEACTEAIGDGYGTRIQLKSLGEESKEIIEHCLDGKGITYEQFTKYMKGETAGIDSKTIEAIKGVQGSVIDALKERQTQEIVDQMAESITSGKLTITELNNYGDEVSSYFTEKQLKQIANAYFEKTGKSLKIVNCKEFESAPLGQLTPDGNGGLTASEYTSHIKTKGAIKDSGYTSSQMNTKHTFADGTTGTGELQIRGTEVNAFADCEHIPYDIRKGKITLADGKYSDIYKVIKRMQEPTYNKYNKFLSDNYKYLRLKELGIETPKPDITKVFRKTELTAEELKLLDIDGLIHIHGRKW